MEALGPGGRKDIFPLRGLLRCRLGDVFNQPRGLGVGHGMPDENIRRRDLFSVVGLIQPGSDRNYGSIQGDTPV